MAELEVEGKTVEDAISDGLSKLGVSRDKAEIKILNEGTTGLFGLMGTKPARVLIVTKDGAAANSVVNMALAQKRVKEVLAEIFKLMGMSFSNIAVSVANDQVVADISSTDSSLLIGKGGQTLESLEHVVNLILNKEPETRVKVSLDTEKYRARQEERLVVIANKGAEAAMSSGKIYRFDPMSAKDRRVIHMTLKDHPDVETFSEGEGAFRKVGVKPKK